MNRNELRRLEKAAREKDKRKLAEWASQFEQQVKSELIKRYQQYYDDQIQCSVDNFMIANWYALHFSEETNLQKTDIASFIEDLFVTVDMFRTGEYKPEEYIDILKKDGITLERYDYDRIYKQFLNTANTELVSFIKSNHRKIITICGSSKYKDIILEKYKDLTLDGNMVFIDAIFIANNSSDIDDYELAVNKDIHKEKILISNCIYVVNADNYIDDLTQEYINYAESLNKEILYYKSDEISE